MQVDSGRILLVEDEMLLRESTREDLTDLGYEVVAVGTAEEAVPIVVSCQRLDVLITDIRMLGPMTGWELARYARSQRPALKVIYTSGYHDEVGSSVEGSRFLQKPYNFSDLARALTYQSA